MVKLANFKEDSKQRNLLVYDYGVSTKTGMRALEVQLDARDSAAKGGAGLTPDNAASLRLVDRQTHYKAADGSVKSTYKHDALYTNNQFDKIVEAAGKKHVTIETKGGPVEVYGIKADLVTRQETFRNQDLESYKGRVLGIDTSKEMSASDFTVGPKVYDNQFKNSMKIRDIVKEAYAEAQANAKDSAEVEVDEPAVDAKGVEMDAPEL